MILATFNDSMPQNVDDLCQHRAARHHRRCGTAIRWSMSAANRNAGRPRAGPGGNPLPRAPHRGGLWQPAANLPTPRAFARSVVFDGRIHVVGGAVAYGASHEAIGTATVEVPRDALIHAVFGVQRIAGARAGRATATAFTVSRMIAATASGLVAKHVVPAAADRFDRRSAGPRAANPFAGAAPCARKSPRSSGMKPPRTIRRVGTDAGSAGGCRGIFPGRRIRAPLPDGTTDARL